VAAGPEPGSVGGYWRQLREGLAFLVREPLLRLIVLLVVVTNFFDAASSSVLLPVYSERELGGAVAFGLLIATMGAGALAGSLLFGGIGHRLPRRATLVVAFTLAGGPFYLALAAGLPLRVLLVLRVLTGFCAGAINPLLGVLMLERIRSGLRARVLGLVNAGCWAGMPLGSLVAGFAVDHAGLRTTLTTVGIAYLLVTLQPLRGGSWRSMDRPRPVRPAIADRAASPGTPPSPEPATTDGPPAAPRSRPPARR
jgi:MFS family permease